MIYTAIFTILIVIPIILIRIAEINRYEKRVWRWCYLWDEEHHLDIFYEREKSAFLWRYNIIFDNKWKLLLNLEKYKKLYPC